MNTSERIKKLGNFFHKMEISTEENETVIYVAVSFPNGWMVDNKTETKFKVQSATQQGITFFWTNITNGEGCVFDAIEYNIKQNREAQEKIKLYNQKVEELRDIFEDEDNTIEDLRALTIVIPKKETSKTPSFVNTNELESKSKLTDLCVPVEERFGDPIEPPTIMEVASDENKKGKKNK